MAKYAQRPIQESFMLPSSCTGVAAAAGIPLAEPPSRGMKSGAGQRQGFVTGSRSRADSPGASGEQPSLANPSHSRPARRRRRRCPGSCLPGANASDLAMHKYLGHSM